MAKLMNIRELCQHYDVSHGLMAKILGKFEDFRLEESQKCNAHIFYVNKEFDIKMKDELGKRGKYEKLLGLKDICEITGYSMTRVHVFMAKAEFTKFWRHPHKFADCPELRELLKGYIKNGDSKKSRNRSNTGKK